MGLCFDASGSCALVPFCCSLYGGSFCSRFLNVSRLHPLPVRIFQGRTLSVPKDTYSKFVFPNCSSHGVWKPAGAHCRDRPEPQLWGSPAVCCPSTRDTGVAFGSLNSSVCVELMSHHPPKAWQFLPPPCCHPERRPQASGTERRVCALSVRL